jgi:hypothetical protein
VREGGSQAVAAETLEANAIGGGHRACGVEAEALDVGAKAGWGLSFGQGVEEPLGGVSPEELDALHLRPVAVIVVDDVVIARVDPVAGKKVAGLPLINYTLLLT